MKKIGIILAILVIVITIGYGLYRELRHNNAIEKTPETIQIYDIEEGYLTVPYNKDAKVLNEYLSLLAIFVLNA